LLQPGIFPAFSLWSAFMANLAGQQTKKRASCMNSTDRSIILFVRSLIRSHFPARDDPSQKRFLDMIAEIENTIIAKIRTAESKG